MKVSVVIPAYRPTFLRQAIASVLAQGREDFDLLISDDSGGGAVNDVVASFRDPRIRLVHTEGKVGGAENLRRLWQAAEGDAIKILHDDDVLLPNCLPDLCHVLEQKPAASFVFGHRDVISSEGRVLKSPRYIQENVVVGLNRERLSQTQVPSCTNRVGEFPNILINKSSGVTWDDFSSYAGFELEMLIDVALYLNASAKGPVVGIGRTVSQYRQHGAQNSTPGFSPGYAKVVGEWEIFVRGEYQAGRLNAEQARAGAETLGRLYALFVDRVPELAILQPGIPILLERIAAQDADVLDADFRRSWAGIDAAVSERKAKAKLAAG
ncbi:glycosyltransferase family 2 protein [Phenylobacterium sp. LjRoot219]|uniref:glycosyltransferase family 2 protein n=1 Tax=Phenylobacterium sp. LjRoot219 TaxID=3342283 RepID=UPI003ECFC328